MSTSDSLRETDDKRLISDLSLVHVLSLSVMQLLVALVSSYRYDKAVVDMTVAKLEAGHLHESIKKKELDHNHIVWNIATRNFFQLRATFACYKQEYSSSIDEVTFQPSLIFPPDNLVLNLTH